MRAFEAGIQGGNNYLITLDGVIGSQDEVVCKIGARNGKVVQMVRTAQCFARRMDGSVSLTGRHLDSATHHMEVIQWSTTLASS